MKRLKDENLNLEEHASALNGHPLNGASLLSTIEAVILPS